MHLAARSMFKFAKTHPKRSFGTSANRKYSLVMCGRELAEMGYEDFRCDQLELHHTDKLVFHWLSRGILPDSVRNNLCHLRYLAGKTRRKHAVRPTNADYGLPPRIQYTNEDRGRDFSQEQLSKLDLLMRCAIELQYIFGLRVQESLKIRPDKADRGDYIYIEYGSKGGRPRKVPIDTPEKRVLLNRAKELAKGGSLIPQGITYYKYRHRFYRYCKKVGITHMHGHRHRYAQNRYFELTGWHCPVRKGRQTKMLTKAQKETDKTARAQISGELGHCRISITNAYLGK